MIGAFAPKVFDPDREELENVSRDCWVDRGGGQVYVRAARGAWWLPESGFDDSSVRLFFVDDDGEIILLRRPEPVAIVARALMLADGRLRGFGDALDAALVGSTTLARLKIAYELTCLVRDRELVDLLADAQEEPWVALRAALEAVALDGGYG